MEVKFDSILVSLIFACVIHSIIPYTYASSIIFTRHKIHLETSTDQPAFQHVFPCSIKKSVSAMRHAGCSNEWSIIYGKFAGCAWQNVKCRIENAKRPTRVKEEEKRRIGLDGARGGEGGGLETRYAASGRAQPIGNQHPGPL